MDNEGNFDGYHANLFQWHCDVFYPYKKALSSNEMAYLECCFDLPDSKYESPKPDFQQLSYFAYSHRVTQGKVNSSRFFYGSLHQPQLTLELALPVLKERGITVPRFYFGENSTFYCLGWDFLSRIFKVYFFLNDIRSAPEKDLLDQYDDPEIYRDEGLVSFIYVDNELAERKVYFYPKGDYGRDIIHSAFMATTTRGLVVQDDIGGVDCDWSYKLCPASRRIIEQYQTIGEKLDSIAYQSPHDHTLYFPY